MLPNFLIIGAQKAGTTSLLNYLSRHPEIYVPEDKEISCFYEDKQYNKQFESYPFDKYFLGWRGEKYCGNAPVNTLFFSEVTAKRIHDLCPSIKMIAVLRNPISRAYSAYWYFVRCGVEKNSFEEALKLEASLANSGTFYERCNFTYVSHGFYYEQLRKFFEHFSMDSLLILLYDELKKNPTDTLGKVCEFLSIDNIFYSRDVYKKYNVSSRSRIQFVNNFIYRDSILKQMYKKCIPGELRYRIRIQVVEAIKSLNLMADSYPPMRASTRETLRLIFRESNIKLGKLIGADLSDWE
jgi:hypothetical protein